MSQRCFSSPVTLRGLSLLLVVLLAAGAGACFAKTTQGKHPGKKDAKRQIEAMENQWRDAQLTGNVAEMSKLLSDDYFGISMTGEVNTKETQLERMRKRTLAISKIELSDMKVKLIGTTAVVTSRAEVQGVNEGNPITGSFRYTRVYQRTAAGLWQITNFEATRLARQGPPLEPEAKP
jgi:ketosteroid isomerase-like protein